MPGPSEQLPTMSVYHLGLTNFETKNLPETTVLEDKIFSSVKSFIDYFVEDSSKGRVIKKILIATNGIAAVKCITSMRRLLMQVFKDDRIVKFVCLTTEQEVESQAEYLKLADSIVFSPSGANTNNYANVDEIVQHAVGNEVDAVWAGWGHASENPKLPEALKEHGIVFIGPPSDAMFALGDKIASTIIAQTVNIPTIEWSGSGIKVPEAGGDSLEVSPEIFKLATVSSAAEGLQCLKDKNITYPVMIKASEGGGGKGIRKCTNDDDFVINFHRVQTEVPGSPIFLMKCMENARHIEVQLIADNYGQVIPIFTRDCSVQRRCQKIIEEAPAGVAPNHVLKQMQQDAVNLAKRVGYISAGTVEYMYLPSTQKYYFLELNPRLQVEHPCTEMVSGINIPAVQLQIAMGLPLHRILDIRLFYGLDRYGKNPLPVDQVRTDTKSCVIAARITSEDPAEGFRPASGTLEVLNFRSSQNVWGYFSVGPSGKVHEFADSQFGHVFAKGATRHEAISSLLCALKELEIRASFQSQVSYLVGLLRDPDFESNNYHTGWLDERIAAKTDASPQHQLDVKIAVGATVIGFSKMNNVFEKFKKAIERGQVLPTTDLMESVNLELVHQNVKFEVFVNRYGPGEYLIFLNNEIAKTKIHKYSENGILVEYAEKTYYCNFEEELERYKVVISHNLTIFEKENDPSILRSRNAGRLLQYLKKDGEEVKIGQIFAEMESMKMVIALDVKKASGKLIQVARPGQVLFPGTVIAKLDVQNDVITARPKIFEENFEQWKMAEIKEKQKKIRLDIKFEKILEKCRNLLDGYSVPDRMLKDYVDEVVEELFDVLENRKLPFVLYEVVLHVVKSRISDSETLKKIQILLEADDFDAVEILATIDRYLDSLNPAEIGMEKVHFEKLQKTCERFLNGLTGHKSLVILDLLKEYLKTEEFFQNVNYDKAVSEIIEIIQNSEKSTRMIFSHTRIESKNLFLQKILTKLDEKIIEDLKPQLRSLANLPNPENEKLVIQIRKILTGLNKSPLPEGTCLENKLEISRIPDGAITVSDESSPYLVYKVEDQGIVRFFVRTIIKNIGEVIKTDKYSTKREIEKFRDYIVECIDSACGEIKIATAVDKKIANDCNHLFFCLDYDSSLKTENWPNVLKEALFAYEGIFRKLKITEVEFSYKFLENEKTKKIRGIFTNETGVVPEFGIYEIFEGFLKIIQGCAKFDGKNAKEKHSKIEKVSIQKKRALAAKLGTLYSYDLPYVFGKAVLDLWEEYKEKNPKSYEKIVSKLTENQQKALKLQNPTAFCSAFEMILTEDEKKIKIIRNLQELEKRNSIPSNDRGMVAWEMHVFSPDSPSGRVFIVISNDVTHQMGSFSMAEHRLYFRASEYSRKNGLPRIYIAANSGARIGFASDIKKKLNVVWNDEKRPEDGFHALCLDSGDVSNDILDQIEFHEENGKKIIDAIIGKENDIGVENLVGSGLIAGETSAAYKEVPTYCLVTGRAVGIGAYAARLAHRIVQVEESHLILTGANALNSLLGREIYTSNGQLGGPQIMHKNGVSHSVVKSDLEGIKKISKWISFLPKSTNPYMKVERNVFLPTDDEFNREVTTNPTKSQYDPRQVLDPPEGNGLFDSGSFDEIMDEWAKTIISARARIGGIPVGVIAVETRTLTSDIPADPAAQDSESKKCTQAGQVWYPDSAYKTAEAINDFNKEGLPLVLLANIRGFSGGQKDMFEMVLKFGACIVDALQAYTQPVIVYIPPFGELRGGAWAVLDTQINPTCITMIADRDSRGGVLEPDGIVEIKFRARDLHILMEKCDPVIQNLMKEMNETEDLKIKKEISLKISKRQTFLTPVYRTIAVKFADLHDTTTRMIAKGAIQDHIQWRFARDYIYRLLSVQLKRIELAKDLLRARNPGKENIDISELTEGCKIIDEKLSKNGIELRKNGNNSKFTYSMTDIENFEKSEEYSRLLNGEKSDVFSLNSLFGSADRTVQLEFLRQQLASLNEEERAKLINF